MMCTQRKIRYIKEALCKHSSTFFSLWSTTLIVRWDPYIWKKGYSDYYQIFLSSPQGTESNALQGKIKKCYTFIRTFCIHLWSVAELRLQGFLAKELVFVLTYVMRKFKRIQNKPATKPRVSPEQTTLYASFMFLCLCNQKKNQSFCVCELWTWQCKMGSLSMTWASVALCPSQLLWVTGCPSELW